MAGGLEGTSPPLTGLPTMRRSQPPTAARKIAQRRRRLPFQSVGTEVWVTRAERQREEVKMDVVGAKPEGHVSMEPSYLFEAAATSAGSRTHRSVCLLQHCCPFG